MAKEALNDKNIDWLLQQLANLPKGFFGGLKIDVNDGKIIRMEIVQSVKPPVDNHSR